MSENSHVHEYIFSEEELEKMDLLEQKRNSRPTFDDILAGLRAEYVAGEEKRRTLKEQQVRAIEELTGLGLSKETAHFLTNYVEDVEIEPDPKPPKKNAKNG